MSAEAEVISSPVVPATASRAALFERVDAIAPVLAGDIEEGERLRRLPDTTMSALRDAGLLQLKVPAVLGGTEAEPALQFEVFERVAMASPTAAWCLFIYADALGNLGARLPDDGLARLFADGDAPVVCGGGGLRPGTLEPVEGGYRLRGSFRYGSGIDGAAWVMVTGLAPRPNGNGARLLLCAVPRAEVTVADTWHVLGMRATGSHDFAVEDVFVPECLTAPAGGRPLRGGRQYRTGTAGYLGYTIPAVCLAIARRAFDDLVARAGTRTRGYARPRPLAERATFQHAIGAMDQRLQAARALMIANGLALMDTVDAGGDLRAADAEVRAAGAFAVRTASDALAELVRFAGGDVAPQGGLFERSLRDLTVAASHLLTDESAYENHGQFLLGIPDAEPMA